MNLSDMPNRTRQTLAQKAGWVRTGIFLPPALYAKVKAAAAGAGITVSAFAEEVFTAYFRGNKRKPDESGI